MSDLVSFVVPLYDGWEFFEQSLDSINNQSYPDVEIVFVAEHGVDARLIDIANSKATRAFRIHQNETKLGLAASLNKGIFLAGGKYIARMDSDDICLPHRIRTQVDYLTANPEVDLCGSFCRLFGDESWDFRPSTEHESIRVDLLLGCPFVHPSVMFHRIRFLGAGLAYDDALGATEDYELWARCSEVLRLGNVNQVLLQYRKHGSAATSRNRDLGRRIYRDVMLRQLQKLLTVTEPEIEAHYQFFTSGKTDARSFARTSRWFERVADANDARGLYNRELLRSTLAWRLLERAEQGAEAAHYGVIAVSPLRASLDESRIASLLDRVVLGRPR